MIPASIGCRWLVVVGERDSHLTLVKLAGMIWLVHYPSTVVLCGSHASFSCWMIPRNHGGCHSPSTPSYWHSSHIRAGHWTSWSNVDYVILTSDLSLSLPSTLAHNMTDSRSLHFLTPFVLSAVVSDLFSVAFLKTLIYSYTRRMNVTVIILHNCSKGCKILHI